MTDGHGPKDVAPARPVAAAPRSRTRPKGTRRACRAGRIGVLTAVTAIMVSTTTVPASAAGDPALDRLIAVSPVPGWQPLSAATLGALVSYENKAAATSSQNATSAAEGWQGGNDTQRLVIVLVRFPATIPSAERNAREGVIEGCASSTGNAPSAVQAYGPIPGSEEATCSGSNALGHTIAGTTLAWVRGNVIVFLEGVGLPPSQVETIARHQDSALPANGIQESSSDTGLLIGLLIALAVVVGVGAAVGLTLRSRARRRTAYVFPTGWPPQPAVALPAENLGVAAGWMPDPTGRHEQRYWSGADWTEHVATNGTPGIDALALGGAPSATGTVSGDGGTFWNGTMWVPTLSDDGRTRWNGTEWVSTDDPS